MEREFEHRLTEVEDRAKSNSHRLEKLEESTEAINRLAISVEGIATKQDGMAKTLNKLDGKVETLEAKPGKRWEAVVEKALMILVSAIVGLVLGKFGL